MNNMASEATLPRLFQNKPITIIGAVTNESTVRLVFVKPATFSSDSGEFKTM